MFILQMDWGYYYRPAGGVYEKGCVLDVCSELKVRAAPALHVVRAIRLSILSKELKVQPMSFLT